MSVVDTTWYGGRPQPRGHCVRWGSISLVPTPIFGPCLSWPNGRMHQNTTCYGGIGGLSAGNIVLDGNAASLPKGHTPSFGPFRCGQMAGWIKMPWYGGRNIDENLNRLSRAHERYRRQTDRQTTDGRAIAFAKNHGFN